MADTTFFVNTASTAGGDGTTNATSGANRAYASLSEFEANEATTINSGDRIICECTGSAADSTSVNISGWTISGELIIRGNRSDSNGFYDGNSNFSTSHYRLDQSTDFTTLTIGEQFVTLDGVQIRNHRSSSARAVTIAYDDPTLRKARIDCGSGSGSIGILGSGSFRIQGITLEDLLITDCADSGVKLDNNSTSRDIGTAFNLTVENCGTGVNITDTESTNTFTLKNTAIANCTDDVNTGGATLTVQNNAAEDDLDTEFSESTNVSIGTLTDAWTDHANGDYTIKDTGSSLYNAGTTGGPSDDIRETTFSTQDIGCFAFVAAGGSLRTMTLMGVG